VKQRLRSVSECYAGPKCLTQIKPDIGIVATRYANTASCRFRRFDVFAVAASSASLPPLDNGNQSDPGFQQGYSMPSPF
jgi:hypothetical protein